MSRTETERVQQFRDEAERVARDRGVFFRGLRSVGLVKTSADVRVESELRLNRTIDAVKEFGAENVKGVVCIPTQQGVPIQPEPYRVSQQS